ncbi:MAG: hypothetical protein AAF355_06185 [Myxococcota bacterium]
MPETEEEHTTTKSHDKATPEPNWEDAGQELRSALNHFASAASMAFDRATKDPALRNATSEAERAVRKIGATAEPMARHVIEEITKLGKRVGSRIPSRRRTERSED